MVETIKEYYHLLCFISILGRRQKHKKNRKISYMFHLFLSLLNQNINQDKLARLASCTINNDQIQRGKQ